MTRLLPLLFSTLLLAGCAAPLSTAGVDPSLTSDRAAAEALRGPTVVWGGVIVASQNLAHTTRLEVLAYPLDSGQRPQTDRPAYGRFLVYAEGYLETMDFAPGRRVSVRGRLDGVEVGKVGQHRYRFPVVHASALHLWPRRSGDGGADVHFGIGLSFGM